MEKLIYLDKHRQKDEPCKVDDSKDDPRITDIRNIKHKLIWLDNAVDKKKYRVVKKTLEEISEGTKGMGGIDRQSRHSSFGKGYLNKTDLDRLVRELYKLLDFCEIAIKVDDADFLALFLGHASELCDRQLGKNVIFPKCFQRPSIKKRKPRQRPKAKRSCAKA